MRWRGGLVFDEPLLFALHLSYLWLCVSFTLLAFHALGDVISNAQVVHAMGAGAIGTTTMIVMMRALLGHTGRAITANRADRLMLLFVHVGAALRVGADALYGSPMLIHGGGVFWMLGFGLLF